MYFDIPHVERYLLIAMFPWHSFHHKKVNNEFEIFLMSMIKIFIYTLAL